MIAQQLQLISTMRPKENREIPLAFFSFTLLVWWRLFWAFDFLDAAVTSLSCWPMSVWAVGDSVPPCYLAGLSSTDLVPLSCDISRTVLSLWNIVLSEARIVWVTDYVSKLQPWNGAWVCVCRGVCVWVRFWLDFQEIDACYQWCVFFVSCLASVWFCFNLSSYPVDAKLDFNKAWFLLYFINLITYFCSINVDSQF